MVGASGAGWGSALVLLTRCVVGGSFARCANLAGAAAGPGLRLSEVPRWCGPGVPGARWLVLPVGGWVGGPCQAAHAARSFCWLWVSGLAVLGLLGGGSVFSSGVAAVWGLDCARGGAFWCVWPWAGCGSGCGRVSGWPVGARAWVCAWLVVAWIIWHYLEVLGWFEAWCVCLCGVVVERVPGWFAEPTRRPQERLVGES